MDKFINAFSRSQYKKDEEGRSYQFAKRLSTTTLSPYSAIKNNIPGPTLASSSLSTIELNIYEAWWQGLDPFSLGIAQMESVHPFLESSGLETTILQQILDLYSDEVRYTKEQFFAILRLIAHIQNGRKMNRDLVALGAPLPRFSNDSIDSLIPQTNTKNAKYTKYNNNNHSITNNNRNSWWGQSLSSQQQQNNNKKNNYNNISSNHNNSTIPTNITTPSQINVTSRANHPHRHSYADSTLSTSTFVSPVIQTPNIASVNMNADPSPVYNNNNNNNNIITRSDHHILTASSSSANISPQFNNNNNNNSNVNNLEWAERALFNTPSSTPSSTLLKDPQNKLNITSPKITTATNKGIYTHSRSRSVPYAASSISVNNFTFDTIASTQTKHDQRPPLTPSRSSMDSASFHRLMQQQDQQQQQQQQQSIDYGQSLLLTQKFVPPASTIKSTNPFEEDNDDDDGYEKEDESSDDDENNDNHTKLNIHNTGMHINQQHIHVINQQEQQQQLQRDHQSSCSYHQTQMDQAQQLNNQFIKSPFEDVDDSGDSESDSDSDRNNHDFLHHTIPSTTRTSTPISTSNNNNNFNDNKMSLLNSNELDFTLQGINKKPNNQYVTPPPVPDQSTKPLFLRYSRHQPLKRSQSQYNGQTHRQYQQHPFMTQGEFLLATSTSSHAIDFPEAPFPSLSSSSNTNSIHTDANSANQLFRHRSISSVSRN